MPLSARLWSGLAFTAFWASIGSAAAPKAEEPKPPEFTDVTQRVDVQFVEGLRSPEATTHEVFVVLKNKSGAPLKGPLAVVFDTAKATDFSFDWYTDTLADGQQYYGLVDVDDELPARQTSRRRKLYLKTAAGVDDVQRAGFQAPLRVVQLSPEHVDSKKPVDEVVEGKKYSREEFDRVMAIQERAADHLISTKPGLAGVFLGEDANGNLNIQVMAHRRGTARDIPDSFEGVPIETTVSGEFTLGAYTKPKGAGSTNGTVPPVPTPDVAPSVATGRVKPAVAPLVRNRQLVIDRPICIGVSGISSVESDCATGTIGARVKDEIGNLYALSNNHVFARMSGVNFDGSAATTAAVNEAIQQPGPLEFFPACTKTGYQVAALSAWEPYRYSAATSIEELATMPINSTLSPVNVMDAAIAATTADLVGFAPPTDGYGALSTNPISPKIGLKIQKIGRTTGWTKGSVSAINGTIILEGVDGVLRFKQCVLTSTRTSGLFGDQGDSGSLVVSVGENRPLGLYFADGPISSIMCPITPILNRFNVQIDDGATTYTGGHSGRMGTAIGPKNRGIRPY